MEFTSVDYIIQWMPLLVILSLPAAKCKPLLAAAGVIWVWMKDPLTCMMMLALTVFNLIMAMQIGRAKDRQRLYLTVAGTVLDAELLVILCMMTAGLFGGRIKPLFGMSYFIFKCISLLIDTYRRKYQNCRIGEILLYLLCVTQITCGPISRAEHFAKPARFSPERFSGGLMRFMTGFCKKVLLADNLAQVRVFTLAGVNSTALVWLNALCFSLQLYYDFGGYSDMAVGLTQMIGYDCPENFDYPYMTASVSEFWRRWHMTLGAWFRDYIYIPMGGSRVGTRRLVFNLFVVWLLTGLWHGFSLHFLIWAGGYFLAVVFEKLTGLPKKLRSRAAKAAYRIAVLLFINFQWVWFSAPDASAAACTIRDMLTLHGDALAYTHLKYILSHDALLLAAALLCCFPIVPRLKALSEGKPKMQTAFRAGGTLLLCALFLAAMGFTASRASNPFVYANF